MPTPACTTDATWDEPELQAFIHIMTQGISKQVLGTFTWKLHSPEIFNTYLSSKQLGDYPLASIKTFTWLN